MGRSFLLRSLKLLWGFGIAGIAAFSFYFAWLQYAGWKAHPLSRFLLPPYRPLLYFFSYVGWRVFAPWLFAFCAAVVAARIADYANRRCGGRFFEPGETRLFGFGVFMTGYPGFLLYVVCMLAAGFLLSFLYILRKKGRAPFFSLWLPVAIFAILLKNALPPSLLNIFIL